jgi:hypothetical protein
MTRMEIEVGLMPASLVRQAALAWPADDWPGWFRYDAADEKKRVCPDWKLTPEPCRDLLSRMAVLNPFGDKNVIPDLSLYGAGMHSMASGEHLSLHLDADTHKLTGLRRRYSSVLFVGDWMEEFGGRFRLWSPDRSQVIASVIPEAGVLCSFECTDEAFHDVELISAPDHVRRKGLAMFWYGPQWSGTKRPRALFVGDGQPSKDQLERAGL